MSVSVRKRAIHCLKGVKDVIFYLIKVLSSTRKILRNITVLIAALILICMQPQLYGDESSVPSKLFSLRFVNL